MWDEENFYLEKKKSIEDLITLVKFQLSHVIAEEHFIEISWNITFSETLLLLPFRSSGAIQGNVPRTPPVTKVFRLIFYKPKSPTWVRKFLSQHKNVIFLADRKI